MPHRETLPIVPIAQINETPESRLLWQLPLPEYVGGQLGVDLEAVEVLGRLGALATITVADAAAREDQPAIGGVQGHGVAAASASLNMFRRKDEARWGTATIVRRPDSPFIADATIGVDVDGVANKLSAQGQLANAAAWSKSLNSATTRGIRRAATRHLATWAASADIVTGMLGLSVSAMIELQSPRLQDASLQHPLGALTTLVLCEFGVVGVSRAMAGIWSVRNAAVPPGEMPLAVLPCSADRLVMFGVQSLRHRNLIRVLE